MDIVTHAALGIVAAGPFIEKPALAAGIIFGSVAPDLDTLSRLFGKRAFLRFHQTYSHSLFVNLVLGILLAVIPSCGILAGIGYFLGAAFHAALDFSNTLGVKILWPFKRDRVQVSVAFFIDFTVLVVALIGFAVTLRQITATGLPPVLPAVATGLALTIYFCLKTYLRTLAVAFAGPRAVSVLPSAFYPWHFIACVNEGSRIVVRSLNLRDRTQKDVCSANILDGEFLELLERTPEWVAMRELSPAYHLVRVDSCDGGRILRCRDFRTRNFNSTFGDLEIHLDEHGEVERKNLHV